MKIAKTSKKTTKTTKTTNANANQSAQYEEASIGCLGMRAYQSGFASLTIKTEFGTLVINGNIREGKDGYFFSMPSFKGKDGEWHNLCYTLEEDFRAHIQMLVNQLVDTDK